MAILGLLRVVLFDYPLELHDPCYHLKCLLYLREGFQTHHATKNKLSLGFHTINPDFSTKKGKVFIEIGDESWAYNSPYREDIKLNVIRPHTWVFGNDGAISVVSFCIPTVFTEIDNFEACCRLLYIMTITNTMISTTARVTPIATNVVVGFVGAEFVGAEFVEVTKS